MKIDFRYPDDPIAIGPAELFKYETEQPGKWYAQFKWDGWRRPAYIADRIDLFSKHDRLAKKIPPPHLFNELQALGFPEGTAFDAEWMGMRQTEILGGRHYMILFDMVYYNGQWQGDVPYEQRYANLKTMFNLHKAKAKVETPNIILEPIVEMGFLNMFNQSKTMPLTEGIVLKRKDSKLKGGLNKAVDNPLWLKCKWRQ